MTLSFAYSPWLLALCAVVAAVLAVWAYHRTTPPLSTARRLLLGGLRFTALFLALFLLFEPTLRRIMQEEAPPVLAVLLDNSQSLRVTSGADSSALRPALQQAVESFEAANPEGVVRYFAFDRSLRPLPDAPSAALDALRLDGQRTDLAAALARVRDVLRTENLRGIVLVSDGQYTTGRNPLYVAERSPVPIHTVVLGDTVRRRDVQIARTVTNEIAYTGAEQPVQVHVRAEGFGGERVRVTLSNGETQFDAAAVTLPDGSGEVPVDLRYTPETPGLQRLTVRVTTLEGEATARNNVAPVTLRVLDSKRRLLLVGAAPGPDLAALRRLLGRDEDLEIVTRVPRGDGAFYEGPLPDSLAAFDAFVLAGFPGPEADPSAARRLAGAIEEGVPALFVLSPQTDLNMFEQHFAEVLPAWPSQVRAGRIDAVPAPTPAAAQHPVFDGLAADAAEMAEQWAQLPPLAVSQSRWQTAPDARVLARMQVRGVAFDDPLLVVRSRGGHRTAALLGSGFWRWSNLPPGFGEAASLWPTLSDNLIQWITTQDADHPVRVEPTRRTFAGSEPVAFTGQVYDALRRPLSDASVQVEVIAPDGTRYPHRMEAAGNGRYVAEIGTLPEGSYRYEAYAEHAGDTLGTDRGAFAVGALRQEFRHTRADAALMRRLAARSGGTFLMADDAAELPPRLAASGTLTSTFIEHERTAQLWHRYPLLILLIVLLGIEWVLRKRSGMV